MLFVFHVYCGHDVEGMALLDKAEESGSIAFEFYDSFPNH